MTSILAVCNNQPFTISTVPTTLVYPNSLSSPDPILIDPHFGTYCDHYKDSCDTCVLYECPTCLQYSVVLNFLTANFPDQFEDYPELLL